MSIIIQRLKLKSFTKVNICPTDAESSFKIYTLICDNKNTAFEDIKNLAENDRKSARTAFIKLFNNAATGQPFQNVFDGQQYHTGHEFLYHESHVKIWRLWLSGKVRIYFIYLPNYTIVVLKTLAKRKNDLTKSEKIVLENITKKIIDCYKNNLMNIIEDKS